MTLRAAVVVFPGSNCDHDALHAYSRVFGQDAYSVWHRDSDLKNPDIVVVPGGFAYGDYLRTGALAKLSPAMTAIARFAERGGPVIGICNGFQILCEAGLLPGVLLQNINTRFLSQFVKIRVESSGTPFTKGLAPGGVLTCPIAHMEGNYFAPPEMLRRIEGEGQIIFRYCGPNGEVDPMNQEWNPNGSLSAIAGVCSARRNIVGLMPHPERAVEDLVGWIGGSSGAGMFTSSLQ